MVGVVPVWGLPLTLGFRAHSGGAMGRVCGPSGRSGTAQAQVLPARARPTRRLPRHARSSRMWPGPPSSASWRSRCRPYPHRVSGPAEGRASRLFFLCRDFVLRHRADFPALFPWMRTRQQWRQFRSHTRAAGGTCAKIRDFWRNFACFSDACAENPLMAETSAFAIPTPLRTQTHL